MKKRESAIRYLEDIFEDGEYLSHGIWVNAYKIELDNMNNFSKWLANNEWELNYTNGNWEKLDDDIQILSFSEVYQLFLKSTEA